MKALPFTDELVVRSIQPDPSRGAQSSLPTNIRLMYTVAYFIVRLIVVR